MCVTGSLQNLLPSTSRDAGRSDLRGPAVWVEWLILCLTMDQFHRARAEA